MIISKTELVDNIKREINDNSDGQITPHDIRHNLLDFIDSVHNLTHFSDLKSKNFDTEQGSRTTRVGSKTLDNFRIGINGYTSVDNTSVGYASLNKNYQGYENTAIGSYALNCNIHGHNNVAVGFNASAANTTGYGNVSIGNYSLHNNKIGNLNIAIGHGAGYYVDRDTSHKLFIASHNIDLDYICSNEEGVGLVPLVQGDLDSSNLKLGIGVSSLHQGAMLQVGGSIHPNQSSNYSFDIGSNTYRFRDIYLSNVLYFAESNYIKYDSLSDDFIITSPCRIDGSVDVSGALDVSSHASFSGNISSSGSAHVFGRFDLEDSLYIEGDVLPKTHLHGRLGEAGKSWLSADIHNLTVTGKTIFNKFEAVEQAHYLHKTIFLASSGYINTIDGGGAGSLTENYHPNDNIEPPVGYLKDEDLSGAGFNIYSKDIAAGYERTYKFSFSPQDSSLDYLSEDSPNSRSHWTSNISLETSAGCHVKTDRIINNSKIGILNYISGLGLFVEDSRLTFGKENTFDNLGNIGDVSFVAENDASDYVFSILSNSNNTNIHQRLLSNFSGSSNLTGYEFSYILRDDLDAPEFFNPQSGQTYDRLVIKGYKNNSHCSRSLIMMNEGNDGFVGINNFARGEYLIPDTILNIRSTGDAIIRVAAENLSASKAGLQMLSTTNCLDFGADLYYNNQDKSFNLDLYYNSFSDRLFFAKYDSKNFGIFTNNTEPNAMLTVGNQVNSDVAISLFENPSFPDPSTGYGKIFTRSVNQDSKTSAPTYVDDEGNYFDFVLRSISEQAGGQSVDIFAFADAKNNTLIGQNSPNLRSNVLTANDNTTVGHSAFRNISTGDRNTIIGSQAGSNLTGNVLNNILIGYSAGNNELLLSNNTVIGNELSSPEFRPTILSNLLLVDNVIEVYKGYTELDNSVPFSYNDIYLKESLLTITNGVVDGLPKNYISIDPRTSTMSFTSPDSNIFSTSVNGLSVTKHYADPQSSEITDFNYTSSTNNYLEILGDLRITGKILWSDGSKIDSGQLEEDVFDLQNELSSTNNNLEVEKQRIDTINSTISSFVIEGYSDGTILPPNNSNSPTIGNLTTKRKSGGSWVNGQTVQITNRDIYLRINRGDFVVAVNVNGEYRPIFVSYGS